MASVSIGRSLFPPEEIRWLATSGIMVTSEPVRDRMVALTRCMSASTSPTNWSIDALEWLSKGTITATPVSTFATLGPVLGYNNRNCEVTRQGHEAVDTPRENRMQRDRGEPGAGIGADQRYRLGVGDRRFARWRPDPPSRARPEHERDRRFARRAAAPHSGP